MKQGKLRYAWVTGVPLAWLAIVTTTAAWQKIFAVEPRIGFLAGANDLAAKLAAGVLPAKQAAVAPQLIFNQRLDAVLTVFFAAVLWLIIVDTLRTCWRVANGRPVHAVNRSGLRADRQRLCCGARRERAHERVSGRCCERSPATTHTSATKRITRSVIATNRCSMRAPSICSGSGKSGAV